MNTSTYDKNNLFMKINGSKRNITYIAPENLFYTGFASVKIIPAITDMYSDQKIDVRGLETIMKSIGLDYVADGWDGFGPYWGFNDPSMMGEDNARIAKEKNERNIVVGITPNLTAAKVNIHGDKFHPSEMEMFGYMNVILDTFVRFVENPNNYNLKKK